MTLLTVSNITKVYGKGAASVTALGGVSFSVSEGEFVAIAGTSGSGKSTLLHIIAGIESATSGEIILDGINVLTQNERELTEYRRDKVATVYQSYNLLPMLNVRDNIVLPSELAGRKVSEDALLSMMKRLGIADKEFYYPSQLSGGQQQRTAIARALISSPRLLLADEPTGNLDSKMTESITEIFRRTADELGQTMIVVTHDERVAAAADRIIRIEDGMIVEDAS